MRREQLMEEVAIKLTAALKDWREWQSADYMILQSRASDNDNTDYFGGGYREPDRPRLRQSIAVLDHVQNHSALGLSLQQLEELIALPEALPGGSTGARIGTYFEAKILPHARRSACLKTQEALAEALEEFWESRRDDLEELTSGPYSKQVTMLERHLVGPIQAFVVYNNLGIFTDVQRGGKAGMEEVLMGFDASMREIAEEIKKNPRDAELSRAAAKLQAIAMDFKGNVMPTYEQYQRHAVSGQAVAAG